jgi:hypothetical protein
MIRFGGFAYSFLLRVLTRICKNAKVFKQFRAGINYEGRGGGMTTRVDLRNLVSRRLGDLTAPYVQNDLQINQWINDAVADYSVYFPQVKTANITAVTGTHEYSLPADFVSMVRVEWPVGREPESEFAACIWLAGVGAGGCAVLPRCVRPKIGSA